MSTEPQEPQGMAALIPSTFAAYAEPGETIDDPAANFRAAHGYIKDRYGSTAAPVAQEPPAPTDGYHCPECGHVHWPHEPHGSNPRDPAPGSAQEPADPPRLITTADELGDWHMVLSEEAITGVVVDASGNPRLICEGEDGTLYATVIHEGERQIWRRAERELSLHGPFRVIWPVQS